MENNQDTAADEKIDLTQLVPESELHSLVEPLAISGTEVALLQEVRELHAADISQLLGLNSAGIYKKKSEKARLSASASILLRANTCLSEYTPRIDLPEPQQLYEAIKAIDPSFEFLHLGILLGLEYNSARRLRDGFEGGSQTVQTLAFFVWRAIRDDPAKWKVIKSCIEVEAESRGLIPGSRIWTEGGWNRERNKE